MTMESARIVHLQWYGPISWSDKSKLNGPTHYGVYQIYGCHSVYGVDTLLYIGKAREQTFARRLSQEMDWKWHQDLNRLCVYIGQCSGWNGTPADKIWGEQIDLAEKLLILAHKPSYNYQMGIDWNDPKLQELHVLNWGSHRSLLPEVSGWRHTSKFDDEKGYKQFSEKRE